MPDKMSAFLSDEVTDTLSEIYCKYTYISILIKNKFQHILYVYTYVCACVYISTRKPESLSKYLPDKMSKCMPDKMPKT